MITILFVDDEELFLESMRKRLESRGFHVLALNRGVKAIEAARRNPVDVAILDLKMPGMDGNELLRILKREHPWIEVIVLTGHGGVDEEFQSVVDGAHAYLHKPCSIEDILDAVAKAYKRRLMNKFKVKEDRLNALIEAENPKGNALGALKAMVKLEKGFKEIS
jgi:DNA-binding NtrC family response regulator